MILPRSSAERKSCFFVSNRSKHTWNQELSEKRDRVSDMRVMRVFEKAQTVVSNCREVFQLSCLHVSQKERPGERVYKLSPSDIWSHPRQGRSPRWSPRSQFPRRGPASWSWTRWRRRWSSTRRGMTTTSWGMGSTLLARKEHLKISPSHVLHPGEYVYFLANKEKYSCIISSWHWISSLPK